MCNMFRYVSNGYYALGRVHKTEVPPGIHKALFENSFRCITVTEWNNIKPHIRNCVSLNNIKRSYIKNHFNNDLYAFNVF